MLHKIMEADQASSEDIFTTYLARLGFTSGLPERTLEFLTTLQTNHIHAFTHDTIDTYFKRRITLNPVTIIKKFLNEERGGLCFELNGAFCHLLKHLGFDAKLMSAKVHGVGEMVFNYPIDTHAVIIVKLNQKDYLVDVGFADSLRKPSLLNSNNKDVSGIYKTLTDGASCKFYKFLSDEWRLQYSFKLAPKNIEEFKPCLEFVRSEKHEFSSNLICTRSTSMGHVALVCLVDNKERQLALKRKLLIKTGDKHKEIPIQDFSEVKNLLVTQLGMSNNLVTQLKEPAHSFSPVIIQMDDRPKIKMGT